MEKETEKMDLAGYKEEIPPENKGTITLDKELIFVARTQRGYEVDYDAAMQWGCSPTETLIASLAGCLAIDVVSFLRKMRAEITDFRIDYSGRRNPTPPQYYTSIDMKVTITGKGLTPKKVERSIALSQDKYCSVQHSLKSDIKVDIKYEIKEEG